MACWLGLDFGTVRTGVALADDEIGLPAPLCVLSGDAAGRAEQVAAIVRERDVSAIVLGLPLSLSGEEGAAALRVRRFSKLLQERLPDVDLYFCDERFSTHAVSATSKANRSSVDAAAAAWILQTFLGSRSKEPDS